MNEERLRRFKKDLETWALRPAERPAAVARARVSARLGSRERLSWRVPAAALLLAVLALGLTLAVRSPEPEPVLQARPARGMVVFQLQSGTKVYFALPLEGAAKGDRS